ncbi:tyrosine-type recombinase/integrase [Candidatus Sulfurimonas baltica]|uniref:Site-specific integrase n=1 Tax=Candidatus Sulfurimonas baltica TaxID=2740404 RepID=A0A7S7LUJ8_9BACT|nr:site-specific integrase [Candidatus Sulfurimonas baltica]QOY51138.1 site-specific integrase [Candidatus Sulfurimonas baltica]
MGTRKDYIKTKYTGIYVKEDSKTKIKTYLARAKVNGTEIEQIVGYSNDRYKTNPSLAFNRRVELINTHKAGKSTKRADNPTLDTFFNEFQDMRKETISQNRWKSAFYFYSKYVSDSLKKKHMNYVDSDDLQKIINHMINEGKKGSYIVTVKEIFSPLFKKAIEFGLVEKNITDYLKFPKYDNIKYFSLPEDKIKELINAIMNIPDNHYKVLFMFLLRGRRSNEIRTLCFEDIDFENKLYTVRDENNKTRKNLTYMLDAELIEHLEIIREKKGLIFKSPVTGEKLTAIPKKMWARIQKEVGIKMRIHDFRHLLGFTLVNNNVPLESISRALGHSKITTTQRYSNQKELMAKDAVDVFLGIVNKK